MRIPPPRHDRGIALIIVMMVILVLSVLAGGFAYSMKVETKLARNTAYESDMEWLGRSGVELGKYALAMLLASPPPENQYFALNQVWAGGPGNPTNDLTGDIQLKGVKLGEGKIDVSIVDMERKFSLAAINNEASAGVLERALTMVGADSGDIPTIIDSYLDWIDVDHNSHLAGAENPFYLRLNPPYFAKNGPVDDIRELLLIKGMTEEVFWGAKRMGVNPETRMRKRTIAPVFNAPENQQSGVGLFDLFTPFHGAAGRVNVNTAPVEVLQILPGVDPAMASAIVGLRSEEPFHNVGELANVPGIDPVTMGAMQSFFTVQSRVFEITVDAEISNYRRRFVALVHLDGPRQVTTLYFTWR
jgi:type II secretory pathway component PulK